MLKYTDTDIVFQEIPDEVTLAVSLSGCPCRCELIELGALTERAWARNVQVMVEGPGHMAMDEIAANIRRRHPRLHTAWWSGRTLLSKAVQLNNFDYIKLGPYLAHLGPLKSRRTNQRLYKVEGGTLHDITSRFWQQA